MMAQLPSSLMWQHQQQHKQLLLLRLELTIMVSIRFAWKRVFSVTWHNLKFYTLYNISGIYKGRDFKICTRVDLVKYQRGFCPSVCGQGHVTHFYISGFLSYILVQYRTGLEFVIDSFVRFQANRVTVGVEVQQLVLNIWILQHNVETQLKWRIDDSIVDDEFVGNRLVIISLINLLNIIGRVARLRKS